MDGNLRRIRPVKGLTALNDDFFKKRMDTLFSVTLPDTFDKLEGDGVLDNYQHVIDGKGEHKACPWHDGLLLETIRGAADYLLVRNSPELENRIDAYASLIERAQTAAGGGYLSTYTILERPNQRYGENGGNLLWQHDLYNCGALFEAGVHYYISTRKTKLLACALRCANELADQLGEPPKNFVVPGHSLPEYALLELYELTHKFGASFTQEVGVPVQPDMYRKLADFWIRGRGHHERRTNGPRYLGEYAQDHAPLHDQVQAVGHAVRATLYYTGATYLALCDDDKELLMDSIRLFNNVVNCKLHINGGIGATHFEEKFGQDYDLPNTAYLETCATVGLIFWAQALNEATGDAYYFNVIERALYNLMLSSFTLQGDSYFYRNPLKSKGDDHHWAWHSCPCCPPMIHKLFGKFEEFIYSHEGNDFYVNLYIASQVEFPLASGECSLMQRSNMPWSGEISLMVNTCPDNARLLLRLPEWAQGYKLQLNGSDIDAPIEKGYLTLTHLHSGDMIDLILPMPVTRIQAHPYVREDRGYVALTRGPLVYCLEGIDNKGIVDITLPQKPAIDAHYDNNLFGGIITLAGKTEEGKPFMAIPLYAWDNRMACPMQVWLKQAGMPLGWSVEKWDNALYKPYED